MVLSWTSIWRFAGGSPSGKVQYGFKLLLSIKIVLDCRFRISLNVAVTSRLSRSTFMQEYLKNSVDPSFQNNLQWCCPDGHTPHTILRHQEQLLFYSTPIKDEDHLPVCNKTIIKVSNQHSKTRNSPQIDNEVVHYNFYSEQIMAGKFIQQ